MLEKGVTKHDNKTKCWFRFCRKPLLKGVSYANPGDGQGSPVRGITIHHVDVKDEMTIPKFILCCVVAAVIAVAVIDHQTDGTVTNGEPGEQYKAFTSLPTPSVDKEFLFSKRVMDAIDGEIGGQYHVFSNLSNEPLSYQFPPSGRVVVLDSKQAMEAANERKESNDEVGFREIMQAHSHTIPSGSDVLILDKSYLHDWYEFRGSDNEIAYTATGWVTLRRFGFMSDYLR